MLLPMYMIHDTQYFVVLHMIVQDCVVLQWDLLHLDETYTARYSGKQGGGGGNSSTYNEAP